MQGSASRAIELQVSRDVLAGKYEHEPASNGARHRSPLTEESIASSAKLH